MAVKKQIKKPAKAVAKQATKSHYPKAAIRRQKVAAGVIAGKTEKKIAEELGTTRDAVATAKEHPEFVRTLAEQLQRHQEKLDALFEKSMRALDEMLIETKPDATRFGVIDRLLKIYEIIQPKQEAQTGNLIQYNQLSVIVRQYREQKRNA